MHVAATEWNLGHLRHHLQYAVDLEFWPVPFYMSATYSIVDRSSKAFRLVESVVNHKMWRTQLVANIANAYGHRPRFSAPVYEGTTIPHLGSSFKTPDEFFPFSAELGPLDHAHVNAMCLMESCRSRTEHSPNLRDDPREYGSLAAFYDAVAHGAGLLKEHVCGGVNQVDLFSTYARDLDSTVVTASGELGWRQADRLIDAVRPRGDEARGGGTRGAGPRPSAHDHGGRSVSRYGSVAEIHASALPAVYPLKPPGERTVEDKRLIAVAELNFRELRATLRDLFAGTNPGYVLPQMVSMGAAMDECWKHGVIANLSAPPRGYEGPAASHATAATIRR